MAKSFKRTKRSKHSKKTIIPVKLKKGSLTKYGYKVHSKLSAKKRSLKRAVKALGTNKVIKKLNILSVYSKKKHPKLSRKIKRDMKFVRSLKK